MRRLLLGFCMWFLTLVVAASSADPGRSALMSFPSETGTVLSGTGPDCNGNGIPDATDIATGTSDDCDGNAIPDECDTAVVFTTRVVSTTAANARSVSAADLDGDGDPDVLSASQADDKIAWYENTDGAGTLGPEQAISLVADGARSVVAADLDGDGDADVLSASQNDDRIAWYANADGLGAFGPQQTISVEADAAASVFAADLDGDGDADVLSASRDDSRIAWYENVDGAGGFGSQRTISLAAFSARSVVAADLDGDGDIDVLSAAFDVDRIAWYENQDGAGDFGSPQTVSTDGDGPLAVHAADADGDGDPDVFAVSINDGEVAWYENANGQGSFGPQQIVNAVAAGPTAVAATDLDGDGDRDVLVATRDDDTVAWHENLNGLGDYGARQVISNVADRAQSVFGIDLDGDLDNDVLSASLTDDKIAWYENESDDCNGNRSPDSCDVLVEDCNANSLPDSCDLQSGGSADCNDTSLPDECDIATGASDDCTADGVPDECEPDCNTNGTADSCDIDGGAADCNLNGTPDECEPDCNGNGTADSCDIEAGAADCNLNGVPDECEPDCNGNGTADSCDIEAGAPDCNGNGVPDECDVASGGSEDCTGNGIPDECEADCNGNGEADSCDLDGGTSLDCNVNDNPDECDTQVIFVAHDVSTLADSPREILAADLDGDGDVDALSASFDDDKIAWYANAGGGSFGAEQILSTTAQGAWSVFAADLDGDGDRDVLSASQADDKVAWYENTNGMGSFGPEQVISVAGDGVVSVITADLDGDGDPDVVASSNSDGEVSWYENSDGVGSFGLQRFVASGVDGPGTVVAADLDGDGDLDVLAPEFFTDRLSWYENTDGAGTFGAQQVISTAVNGPWSVVAADIDGDGDDDVLSASQNDDKVAWYEKLDEGDIFGPQQVITTAADFARAVLAADLDGDGDYDALSASEVDGKFAWYENTDGAGGFGSERLIAEDLGAFSVDAADLDGDGDTDVLSSAFFTDRIAWHENLSDDCDANTIPDECEPDCNANGVADSCDITSGASGDCNATGVPDECDIEQGGSADCTGDGVPDECEPDCNANDIADSCDIDSGFSDDCNANVIPDECEPDCNGNNQADGCDIDGGGSLDCTLNGIPDECEPDCNGNGEADSCDLDTGFSDDCDANDVPDECDISSGEGSDCDASGTLDSCETTLDFDGHLISTAANFVRTVFAADLDLDGDTDVLSASFIDNKIAWYENTDGQGDFGPQQIISSQALGGESVFAMDLDGDLDVDVLSSSFNNDRIAWYENTNGAGSFGPARIVSSTANGADSAVAADLDGDGAPDVLAASYLSDRISWFENTDGAGNFGPEQIINFGVDGAFAVFAADVDDDGDVDALSASELDDTISWYENEDGAGQFGSRRVISADAAGALSVFAADLDGDLALDIVSASHNDDKIAWHRNIDGLGGFGPQQIISTETNDASTAYASDVDGDGDLDVVSTSFSDSRVAWFENTDGAGGFGPLRLISTAGDGAFSAVAVDVDGDGDTDVVAGSVFDDRVAWYENASQDCNGNGLPDVCDLPDCTGNGIPDQCEPDCNGNGIADSCDIAALVSDDCDFDGLPDECEQDCNGNGVADGCDLSSGTSDDCDTNGVPDDCQADCSGDGVPDVCEPDCNGNDVADGCDPACNNGGSAELCDTDADTCDDCASGSFNPANDGADFDSDGACDAGDCEVGNPRLWAVPGPVGSFDVSRIGNLVQYAWAPPAAPGAQEIAYDTLRSPSAADFTTPAICFEFGGLDTITTDFEDPLPGAAFYYLVRAVNECPNGIGSLGTDSAGTPRTGLACP